MKRFLLPVLALMLVLSFSLVSYEPAKAQTCTTNCYYASTLFLKNMNGTSFTGTASIYVPQNFHGWRTETFTNGVLNSGYVWAGQIIGTWGGVCFYVYTGGTWRGSKCTQVRSSTPPFLPVVTIVQFVN